MNDLKSFFATTTGKIIVIVIILGVGVLIGTHGLSKSQPVEQPQAVAVVPVTPPSEVTPPTPVPIASKPTQSTSKKTTIANKPTPVTTLPAPASTPTTSAGTLTVSGGTTINNSIKQGATKTFFTTMELYPFLGTNVVNSITITRTGSSQDSDIGDIYLVDYPYGKKIFAGPQRLNADHQVVFTGPWTFKHGDDATGFAIQADVVADATVGDIIKLPITAINTTSTLLASSSFMDTVLPVNGSSITITAGTSTPAPASTLTWHTAYSVSSSTTKQTEPFTIKGSKWRVSWNCTGGNPVTPSIYAYTTAGDSVGSVASPDTCPASDMTYFYNGSGEYYFKVSVYSEASISATVEDYY